MVCNIHASIHPAHCSSCFCIIFDDIEASGTGIHPPSVSETTPLVRTRQPSGVSGSLPIYNNRHTPTRTYDNSTPQSATNPIFSQLSIRSKLCGLRSLSPQSPQILAHCRLAAFTYLTPSPPICLCRRHNVPPPLHTWKAISNKT